MIVSTLYALIVLSPGAFVEAGRYDQRTCATQADLGNQMMAGKGVTYRCVPVGHFQRLDRPT